VTDELDFRYKIFDGERNRQNDPDCVLYHHGIESPHYCCGRAAAADRSRSWRREARPKRAERRISCEKEGATRVKIPAGIGFLVTAGAIAFLAVGYNIGSKSSQVGAERSAHAGSASDDYAEAMRNHRAVEGMTASQVRKAWGEPKRIILSTDTDALREEWIYGSDEKGARLFFVNGSLKDGMRTDGK
jgi:hypothetical protein